MCFSNIASLKWWYSERALQCTWPSLTSVQLWLDMPTKTTCFAVVRVITVLNVSDVSNAAWIRGYNKFSLWFGSWVCFQRLALLLSQRAGSVASLRCVGAWLLMLLTPMQPVPLFFLFRSFPLQPTRTKVIFWHHPVHLCIFCTNAF